MLLLKIWERCKDGPFLYEKKHGISFYLFILSLVFFIVFRASELCTSKKECNKLDLTPALSISDSSILMIGTGGLLLVVPVLLLVGLPKK